MVKDIFPSSTFPVAYFWLGQDNGTLSYQTEISLKFKTKKTILENVNWENIIFEFKYLYSRIPFKGLESEI